MNMSRIERDARWNEGMLLEASVLNLISCIHLFNFKHMSLDKLSYL